MATVSVAVGLEELAAEIARRGFGYLLTTGDDRRPKAVALVPTVVGRTLRFDAGGGSAHNATARPSVSVVFPPTADDEFSLVVDGDAAVETADDDDGTPFVVVTPTWAVRHRPAP